MKKTFLLLLVLGMFLTGCSPESAAPSYAFEDLSIQIPEDYINLSDESFATDLDFVFGLDPIGVNGLREKKATFEAYGLELDLEGYSKFLMMSNNVSSELVQTDGIWNFTYTADGFTYVVTLWETQEAFWMVQAYCPTENYAKAKKDMWNILSSITV